MPYGIKHHNITEEDAVIIPNEKDSILHFLTRLNVVRLYARVLLVKKI